jgi:hypothetical protein
VQCRATWTAGADKRLVIVYDIKHAIDAIESYIDART